MSAYGDYYSLAFDRISLLAKQKALTLVKQAEKKAFPRNEVIFDFDKELQQRIAEPIWILDTPTGREGIQMAAYLVSVHNWRTDLLHKLTIVER